MNGYGFPKKQGLYDPQFEKDSCGVGFVCNVKGKKSHDIVRQGLEVLSRLSHRGATGADPKTGDGAGILIQIPHEFFVTIAKKNDINLPDQGKYGTGLVFFPRNKKDYTFCKETFLKIVDDEKQCILGWRNVDVDSSFIGDTAKKTQPVIEQVFIRRNDNVIKDALDFERKLYIIRKRIENIVRAARINEQEVFYITNLSCRTFSYKGLLMPEQLDRFFPELGDNNLKSAISLVHSRYSTNTFPTWDLAQPFRFLAHNGEINTLRGNINWMKAREGLLQSRFFGKDIEKIKPVIVPGGSDSAAIDNAFELLTLAGRPLPHVMMMLIPCAWENDNNLSRDLRAFYKYHASFMEPWDGPAAIAFTDGVKIGAVLDRNGLRPARYIVTKDDLVVMASEVGVFDIGASRIAHSGRLEPGKMFFIDTEAGRIVDDNEIKKTISKSKPYAKWLKNNLADFKDAPKAKNIIIRDENRQDLLKVFGYTREDLDILVKPMAEHGKEPIGSMGNDTPCAVLSTRPQLVYNYFKQLFAQVTNPAIDSIREQIVMAMETYIGAEKNLLEESPEHCKRLRVKNPILTDEGLRKLSSINIAGFKTKTIPALFKINSSQNLCKALNSICADTFNAIEQGYTFIILSDRGVNKNNAPIPMPLAVGAVHQYLVKKSVRNQIGLIVESAEPREVHHFAVLFGYGADCINPYLVYSAIQGIVKEDDMDISLSKAITNYIEAVNTGILKILSKMGISTLQSYRGAQIFEALGLGHEVIEKCFTGTPSRIGGSTFEILAEETICLHKKAYCGNENKSFNLPSGGLYKWRRDGEFHLWNPESIAALQDAAVSNEYKKYKEFASLINDQSKNPTTIRGLFEFQIPGKGLTAIPIEEVEPKEEIFKRFATGAMSFGSISSGTHESLAIAMNRIGGKSNTGEGGEDPARFIRLPNGDSARSAIKQVASGRFGVNTNYLVNADELQIKIAQGAKPGEGGQLPGHKVSAIIARTRYTTPGVTLISPPPHHDIYSIEDLAQLIFDLKNVNPRARISVKLVSEIGVGTVAAGVAKGHADMILISGGDGGTGASPLSSIKHAGLPWELGLSETHQALILNNLRSRVRLQTDGQMRTGKDVAIAALLGAEEFGFCTAGLIVLGCVMLRHCHLNNCSVGIATQDVILGKRFHGRPEHVVNYFNFVADELREIMAGLGLHKVDDMIGRADLLKVNNVNLPWKAKGLDLSRVLYMPEVSEGIGRYCQIKQNHAIDNVMDRKLIQLSKKALEEKGQVEIELPIANVNRTVGAMLSGEVCKLYGESALPEDSIHCKFRGAAGQSFGAFLAKGVTCELEGLANDYIGKGISGGKIVVYPDRDADYKAEDNIIIGNTSFYGAISGEAYIRGVAGERFCIRNSGLNAVVEGVGDHACEYMTGGRVIILGTTGRNFAAGMSGGIAYVYDKEGVFKDKCNMEMVELEGLSEEDKVVITNLLVNHKRWTKSPVADKVLNNFNREVKKIIKVMPIEYKRILGSLKAEEKLGLLEASDG